MKDMSGFASKPNKSAVIGAIIIALAGLLIFCVLIKKDIEKTEIITIDKFD